MDRLDKSKGFILHSEYEPTGDQPKAIETLAVVQNYRIAEMV